MTEPRVVTCRCCDGLGVAREEAAGAAHPLDTPQEPEPIWRDSVTGHTCPSEHCPYCNGEACRQHEIMREPCECDVIQRHEPYQAASLPLDTPQVLQKMAACSHERRWGGNDYMECQTCGLMWDYRKETPEQQIVKRLAASLPLDTGEAPTEPKKLAALRQRFSDHQKRVNDYLSLGGVWNPELMNNDAVRDLFIDTQQLLSELADTGEATPAPPQASVLDSDRWAQTPLAVRLEGLAVTCDRATKLSALQGKPAFQELFERVSAGLRDAIATITMHASPPSDHNNSQFTVLWQPIETAPRDGTRIDICAKAWLPAFDRFEFARFTDCVWMAGDSMCNRPPYWLNVGEDWHPTHWMPLPSLPSAAEKEHTK